jgi:hypothetical protein
MGRVMNLRVVATAVALLLVQPSLAAGGGSSHTSHDGLELVKKTRSTELWVRPGATLKPYTELAILDCPVAFAKNWERDQNEDAVGLMDMVTQKDMDQIKAALSKEFLKVFTRVLQTKGGYKIVDFGAKNVLVLRPAIINLDITAPDLMTPGMSQTFTASAGSMTLYLELYDSVSSQILARYVNAAGDTEGMMGISDRVTNVAAADRILTRWADRLRTALDDAHKEMGGKAASAAD